MDVEVLARALSRDAYPLQGWLFCICGQAFVRLDRTDSARRYQSLCGCRLWPIDADTVEQLVYATAAGTAEELIGDGCTRWSTEVYARLFIRVEIGGTVDDIRIVPRT